MKAIHATRFGDPTVLVPVDLPDPAPGPGQVAIDVSHSAVGLVDVFLRQGIFKDRPGLPQPPFVPGLEVAGTVRALGESVTGFTVGEKVVAFSSNGSGGYASVYVGSAPLVVSLEGHDIDLAHAVSVVPNAAMAFVAFTSFARLGLGETVLVHGALGGFASAFPGIAKHLGARRVVGSVRTSRLPAAAKSKLPYDEIIDSASLGDETFDVIIDPVGGALRSRSLELLRPGGRLLLVGNASGEWSHTLPSNQIWGASAIVAGFSAGSYLPTHLDEIRPAAEAALKVAIAGQADPKVDVLPLSEARAAHARMESRDLDGRIVLEHAKR